jgi:hypothetical protein
VSPPLDFICSLREHNARALDQLLRERFGGKVGRGLAVETSRRRVHSSQVEALFAPVFTVYSQDSETCSIMGHNAGCKRMFVVKRRRHGVWT